MSKAARTSTPEIQRQVCRVMLDGKAESPLRLQQRLDALVHGCFAFICKRKDFPELMV